MPTKRECLHNVALAAQLVAQCLSLTVLVKILTKSSEELRHRRTFMWKCLTCDVDVHGGEGCQRHCSDILSSDPQHKVPGGLIVQRLCYQDGGRTVLTVRGQVEADRHVSLWDHSVCQVVGYPWVSKRRGRFDGLCEMKTWYDKINCL